MHGVQRGTRARRAIVMVVAVGVMASACGVKSDKGATANRSPKKNVAGQGDTASTTTSTTTTTPAPTGVTITGDNGGPTNKVLANAIADLEDFWGKELPASFGIKYQPVSRGFYAVDPAKGAKPPCADSAAEVADNAFYCYGENLVLWDQVGFMPTLQKDYGAFTPALVMAHEWGHAIQDRIYQDPTAAKTVTREMQADCFAGVWVKHVQSGESSRFKISVADLDLGLAGLLYLRDEPGGDANDPQAHGSGFDRVSAFQTGFEQGAKACGDFVDGNPTPLEFPFSDKNEAANQGNLPYDEIIPLALKSLEAFWTKAYPQVDPGKTWEKMAAPKAFTEADPPSCGGDVIKDYSLFFCVPDNYVAYDTETFMPKLYKEAGDFAVAALLGTQYGLAVQYRKGDSSNDEETSTLRGDCYMGAWAKSALPYKDNPSELLLSSGDLDEAISALLKFRGPGDRERQGPGFNRVRAFRTGVLQGTAACTNKLKG
ncbi:MAG: putative metalloprotease [Acidimicrobiales bacterium]|nr:putative metalloprotease [Acidimicrobiales bacterium]